MTSLASSHVVVSRSLGTLTSAPQELAPHGRPLCYVLATRLLHQGIGGQAQTDMNSVARASEDALSVRIANRLHTDLERRSGAMRRLAALSICLTSGEFPKSATTRRSFSSSVCHLGVGFALVTGHRFPMLTKIQRPRCGSGFARYD